jgi:HTH-type transcriptional regulator/antitoxin HigA
MKVRLIKSDSDYRAALERIDDLLDITPDSKEFDEIELLITLVDLYEQKHHPIEAPDPIEAIKFRMEQMDLKRVDLVKFFGTQSRVSEILNRQRKLTVEMMRKLHKDLGIPATSLLA